MERYGDYDALAGIASLGAGLFIFLMIIVLGITVFTLIVKWKVFEKAGKPGWLRLSQFTVVL